MVRLNIDEAELVLEALGSKAREYAAFPPEIQQVFMMPYQQLHFGITTALAEERAVLDKEQKKSSSSPKAK